MTASEKTELAGIGVVTVVLFLIHPLLPEHMELGYVLVSLGLLFLLQSLLRDLWILSQKKNKPDPTKQGRFMCLESIIGFAPLIASALIIVAGWREAIDLPHLFWPLSAAAVMMTCFLIKDWVIDLKALRIRKEKDHINIIFKWNPQ